MRVWQVLNLILFVSCFAGFSWSICRHFKQPAEKGFGMRLITALGSFFMLVHGAALVFFYRGGVSQSAAGAVLYLLAMILFWSAIKATSKRPFLLAYSAEAPQHVLTAGPYRRIRHPFYTSYSLAWLAGMMATNQPLLFVSFVVMFSLYFQGARREEAQFAESNLREEYQAYRRQSGMFFPRFKPSAQT